MKIERGMLRAFSLEESKRVNVFFEEVQQIDEKGVKDALLYSLNRDVDFEGMFYRIDIDYAELSNVEEGLFKIYGFGYAFSDKLIVKINFNFDVNDFCKNTVQIGKRFINV